jgi:two-component system sensor histidine kinase BaeS
LDNALHHTPRGGTVTVDLDRRNGLLSIHIADTGKGFSPAFFPVALEPFSRSDSGRARDDGGTGLGLAIVRAIAEAHGGSVEVGNRPEGGALVIIRLPV